MAVSDYLEADPFNDMPLDADDMELEVAGHPSHHD